MAHTRAYRLREKWAKIKDTSTRVEHQLARMRETFPKVVDVAETDLAVNRVEGAKVESRIRPKGSYEIQVWDTRFSPKYGWQCYYGAYMFHRKKLASVLRFIKEQCFFCGDLNDQHHTEIRLKNVRTGGTMPLALLFSKDPEYHECQGNRRARNR